MDAKILNLVLYAFHLFVGVFFLTPIHVPEFIVNILIFILVWKKSKWGKWLLYGDMALILIVLGAMPFTQALMKVTYFSSFFESYPMPLAVLVAAWIFYLCNTLFWIHRIDWK